MREVEPAVPIPEGELIDDRDRGLVVRGQKVLACTMLLFILVTWGTDRLGLSYVQNIVWPSDLTTFQLMETEPLDVVILGSSRASFGFSPSAVDQCLTELRGRPAHSVNLARVYSTPLSWRALVEGLLVEERIPDVLVIGIAPESFNEEHHQNSMIFQMEGRLGDVPALVAQSKGLHELTGAVAPLFRGAESLALVGSGRYDNEERLRWMMLHHGGGQFCVGSEACKQQNQAFEALSAYRWRKFARTRSGFVQAERFHRYRVGDGIYHQNMIRLLEWAATNSVQVLAVNMPLHPFFEKEIPPEVVEAYTTYVVGLEAQYSHFHTYDGNYGSWRSDTSYFLDPDHLGEKGSIGFSQIVCEEAIAPLMASRD